MTTPARSSGEGGASDGSASGSSSSASPASLFAGELLEQLIRAGVRDVVVCPGSRSQALALAAAALELAGAVRLHVRVDERVAGFLALGLSLETDAPVPVVVTSGTAVANLHPAVLEAHHSGVRLVVLSADRPAELRGTGSNQTTLQPGVFGPLVGTLDVEPPDAAVPLSAVPAVVAAIVGAAPGPVHVNLQLREPLSGEWAPTQGLTPGFFAGVGTGAGAATGAAASAGSVEVAADELVLTPRVGTVVVAGAGAGREAEQLARTLGAPLLAEVSSGARFGPHAVADYRRLLDHADFGGRVDRAIVLGHPTLSRQVPALMRRPDVETVVVRGRGDPFDPWRRARIVDAVRVEGEGRSRVLDAWTDAWVAASRQALAVDDSQRVAHAISDAPLDQARFNREVLQSLHEPVSRRALVEALWRFTWPHDRLVLGASRLIREADQVVPGKRIPVLANRGLAGIDGTIATATGVAIASQGSGGTAAVGITRLLLGDVAFTHDLGSLVRIAGETQPRLQIIVGDDHGGTIFDGLEVKQSADAAAFDRVMLTSVDLDLPQLAAGFGWRYVHAADRGALEDALAPTPAPTIIHVPLAR